jgi:hypothetical protein
VRTPAGVDCEFYYQDYHRGRGYQECRLIARDRTSEPWRPGLCRTCPIPRILRANRCPNMALEARVKRRFGLLRRVEVLAVCTLQQCQVKEPMVGCGECHRYRPGAALFMGDEEG